MTAKQKIVKKNHYYIKANLSEHYWNEELNSWEPYDEHLATAYHTKTLAQAALERLKKLQEEYTQEQYDKRAGGISDG